MVHLLLVQQVQPVQLQPVQPFQLPPAPILQPDIVGIVKVIQSDHLAAPLPQQGANPRPDKPGHPRNEHFPGKNKS